MCMRSQEKHSAQIPQLGPDTWDGGGEGAGPVAAGDTEVIASREQLCPFPRWRPRGADGREAARAPLPPGSPSAVRGGKMAALRALSGLRALRPVVGLGLCNQPSR